MEDSKDCIRIKRTLKLLMAGNDGLKRPAATILDLKPVILRHIFKYLDVGSKGRVARVCYEWRDAVYHPSMWRGIWATIRLDGYHRHPHHCRDLHPLIATLSQRRIAHVNVLAVTGRGLNDLLDRVDTINVVSLKKCDGATDELLCDAFMNERKELTSLTLFGCGSFTNATVAVVSVKLKNLTALKFERCPQLNDLSVLLIAKGLVCLVELHLGFCPLISDVGIGHLSDRVKLKILTLESCDKLTSFSLAHLRNGQQNVETFRLLDCKLIANLGMQHVAKMNKLSSLFLKMPEIGDTGLSYLTRGGNNITFLSLIGSRITQRQVNNRFVRHNIVHFTDKLAMDSGLNSVGRMANLVTLSLKLCEGITDVGLRNLTERQSRLKQLILDGCNRITDRGLKHVAKLKRLCQLELVSCNNVGNAGLDNLVEGGYKITSLKVKGCELVGPEALRILSSGLLRLRYLELDSVNDLGLAAAARTLLDLISLKCASIEMIASVRQLRFQQLRG